MAVRSVGGGILERKHSNLRIFRPFPAYMNEAAGLVTWNSGDFPFPADNFSVERRYHPCNLPSKTSIYLMKVKFERRDSAQARGAQGFTLLEMVIVLGIIGLILGAVIGLSGNFMGLGREVQTEGKLQTINASLKAYRIRANHFPSESQGLKALVERPTTAPEPRRWENAFETLPKDGWDQEFVYKYPGSKDPSQPEVISKGKDGELGTGDDLSSQDAK
ncbi:MAG: type II secretion system protein GspG [Roseibacillus sp.]|nr:type II secretion system protein GspG [Roseibacillus sp.]